ncbi:hypothetical protein [uncultured Oscillibacter sp.]|uniref:hypothetical protein n=1 Tax=uncultured Oscillibacter sp. TaxID=876091 RepID=UPI0025E32868|nr:hypothetical protein [uncultured Oscillibacter sp.]
MPDEETEGLDAETFLQTLDDRLLQMTDDEVYQRLDEIDAEEALLNWHDDSERMLELTREYGTLLRLLSARLERDTKQFVRHFQRERRRCTLDKLGAICWLLSISGVIAYLTVPCSATLAYAAILVCGSCAVLAWIHSGAGDS